MKLTGVGSVDITVSDDSQWIAEVISVRRLLEIKTVSHLQNGHCLRTEEMPSNQASQLYPVRAQIEAAHLYVGGPLASPRRG